VTALYKHLTTNFQEPINIVAHSQGGIILSRALRDVRNKLIVEQGLTKEQAIAKMSNIQVQTGGAAAVRYPNGPQYLHYINNKDPIPTFISHGKIEALDSLKKGSVARFTNPEHVHSMDNTYSLHLKNFNDPNWNKSENWPLDWQKPENWPVNKNATIATTA